VSRVHTHRQFSILTVDGKKRECSLIATFNVADSEVFSEELKDIILSENSLNVATPGATEPEPHTHSVAGMCLCMLVNILDVGAEGTVQGSHVGAVGYVV